jgi:hypothetical protein
MVVTDLHGDKDAFARHVGRFLQLRSRNRVQRLLLLGDLIHSERPPDQDESLPILLDLMRMRNSLGPDAVIMLLGNHEMPHLYGVSLQRGNIEYTPRFEKALTESGRRDDVIAFLDALPFYARTAAGVAFTHAGPEGNGIANFDQLRHFDHKAILAEFSHVLTINPDPDRLRKLYSDSMGMPYEVLARYYLAVEGPDDPRYDDLLRAFMITQSSEDFVLLWGALFTRCEKEVSLALYERILSKFLDTLSEDAPVPQRLLVTGHIPVRGGHAIVTPQHLRLASAAHATPREAGQYLLFDAGKPIESTSDLESRLGSVFGA